MSLKININFIICSACHKFSSEGVAFILWFHFGNRLLFSCYFWNDFHFHSYLNEEPVLNPYRRMTMVYNSLFFKCFGDPGCFLAILQSCRWFNVRIWECSTGRACSARNDQGCFNSAWWTPFLHLVMLSAWGWPGLTLKHFIHFYTISLILGSNLTLLNYNS